MSIRRRRQLKSSMLVLDFSIKARWEGNGDWLRTRKRERERETQYCCDLSWSSSGTGFFLLISLLSLVLVI